MRVFQGPVDIAWQASTLANELRRQGVNAISVNYSKTPSSADRTIIISRRNPFNWIFSQVIALFSYGNGYDIYHFHFAKTFLPLNIDILILKILKKKIVFHFHGCDIRDHHRKNVVCGQCSKRYRDFQQPLTKWVAGHMADKVYVSTPDLLEDFPRAEYLPVAYPWKIGLTGHKDSKLVVHASTDDKIKGTKYVLEAVQRLQRQIDFKFQLISRMPHAQAQKIFQRAGIGVDQLFLGWHGLFSLELLAQGKPVICYINPKLKIHQPDLPILTTNTQNIYNDLESILLGKSRFDAAAAVSFVKRVHSPEVIVARLIEDYKKL